MKHKQPLEVKFGEFCTRWRLCAKKNMFKSIRKNKISEKYSYLGPISLKTNTKWDNFPLLLPHLVLWIQSFLPFLKASQTLVSGSGVRFLLLFCCEFTKLEKSILIQNFSHGVPELVTKMHRWVHSTVSMFLLLVLSMTWLVYRAAP